MPEKAEKKELSKEQKDANFKEVSASNISFPLLRIFF
jgi:hypothetical protein